MHFYAKAFIVIDAIVHTYHIYIIILKAEKLVACRLKKTVLQFFASLKRPDDGNKLNRLHRAVPGCTRKKWLMYEIYEKSYLHKLFNKY